MNRGIHQRIGTVATVALLAVACGGGTVVAPSSVAGNADTKAAQNKLVLTIVTGEASPAEAMLYATAVEEISEGSIEVKIDNTSVSLGPVYEQDLINYVADGKAQLGFTAARAFDTLGVSSFVGLHAPFLIESYELQEQVLASDWAKALLEGTRPAGVVGVGYQQGPMRRPVGFTHELVDLADYNGARIGIRKSALTEMTMKALGATPVPFTPDDISGLDGMEAHLSLIRDAYAAGADSVTGNVIFWSRPGVIFANNQAFDALTADQKDILRRAADKSFAESVVSIGANAAKHPEEVCERGLKMVDASDGTLAELRAAVQPVYDEIEKDPGTKATIDAIKALRAASTAKPDAVECNVPVISPAPPAAAVVSPIDGTWRVCYTLEELMAAGADAGENQQGNAGCGTKTFRKGQFWELRDGFLFDPGTPNGTFTVEGSTVALKAKSETETWQFEWSIFNDTLTFKKAGAGGPTGFVVKPFHKEADLASPIVGTYKTSITKEELAASPLLYDSHEANDGNWGDFTITFDPDGKVTFTQANAIISSPTSGTYSATEDHITLAYTEGANIDETFGARWSLFRDTLTFERTDEELPTPYVVKAWTRVP
jgi:TRAP-type C4-dicarboxylate transport system substrate-binding protein